MGFHYYMFFSGTRAESDNDLISVLGDDNYALICALLTCINYNLRQKQTSLKIHFLHTMHSSLMQAKEYFFLFSQLSILLSS